MTTNELKFFLVETIMKKGIQRFCLREKCLFSALLTTIIFFGALNENRICRILNLKNALFV